MKKAMNHVSGIVVCLLEVLVGILLLIKPVEFTKTIIIGFGVVMLIYGIWKVVQYFRTDAELAADNQILFQGLILLLMGGFCVFQSEWFIATFPVLTMLYGIAILVGGVGKIQKTVDMLRMKKKKWYWTAISAAISIVGAVVILMNPFSTTAALWVLIGISFIVEAIFDAVAMLFGRE